MARQHSLPRISCIEKYNDSIVPPHAAERRHIERKFLSMQAYQFEKRLERDTFREEDFRERRCERVRYL
jgi:hypothetical protein